MEMGIAAGIDFLMNKDWIYAFEILQQSLKRYLGWNIRFTLPILRTETHYRRKEV